MEMKRHAPALAEVKGGAETPRREVSLSPRHVSRETGAGGQQDQVGLGGWETSGRLKLDERME